MTSFVPTTITNKIHDFIGWKTNDSYFSLFNKQKSPEYLSEINCYTKIIQFYTAKNAEVYKIDSRITHDGVDDLGYKSDIYMLFVYVKYDDNYYIDIWSYERWFRTDDDCIYRLVSSNIFDSGIDMEQIAIDSHKYNDHVYSDQIYKKTKNNPLHK